MWRQILNHVMSLLGCLMVNHSGWLYYRENRPQCESGERQSGRSRKAYPGNHSTSVITKERNVEKVEPSSFCESGFRCLKDT
ncbi:hypothetical protein E2C01_089523 [Portunus trituberculatus]|uniref:Secreted protein n=1 Tax=Portunus trituberculatus TaxID=210409 RepID=A0A5B7JMN1_PORTR|nr:hypothetical protein [Portunus trituberculatus]